MNKYFYLTLKACEVGILSFKTVMPILKSSIFLHIKLAKSKKFKLIKNFANFFWSLLFLIFININNSKGATSRNLIIFSEPNLSKVLALVAREFSQKNNTIISINYNSAFDLIDEIDIGSPVNIFITAHPQIIENLRQKGVVDVYNVAYVASDSLALCTNKANNSYPTELLKKNINFDEALKLINKNQLSLIIDHEGSSAGFYSKKFIEDMNLGDIKLFNKLPEDKSLLLRDLENNDNVFGLIFTSQLHNSSNLNKFSVQKDKSIFYQAFVIAGDNMDGAREFLNFLKSPKVQKIFKDNGFNIE